MTRAQYRKNYRILVRNVTRDLRQFGERALKQSNCIDLTGEMADFRVPKNVLVAALERIAGPAGYGPLKRTDKKHIKQIRYNTPLY